MRNVALDRNCGDGCASWNVVAAKGPPRLSFKVEEGNYFWIKLCLNEDSGSDRLSDCDGQHNGLPSPCRYGRKCSRDDGLCMRWSVKNKSMYVVELGNFRIPFQLAGSRASVVEEGISPTEQIYQAVVWIVLATKRRKVRISDTSWFWSERARIDSCGTVIKISQNLGERLLRDP